jgi:hypothetical protein
MTRNVTPMIGESPVYPGYAFGAEADTYGIIVPTYPLLSPVQYLPL